MYSYTYMATTLNCVKKISTYFVTEACKITPFILAHSYVKVLCTLFFLDKDTYMYA